MTLQLWMVEQETLARSEQFLVNTEICLPLGPLFNIGIGVKNPIRLASAILDNSRTPDALGRIPPMYVPCLPTSRLGDIPSIGCL